MGRAARGRVAAGQLAAAGAALTAVALAWPVLVWRAPAGSRPWISGTSDNSVWSLITGYNGLGRLFGQDGGPGAAAGGGGVFDSGPSVFRLLNTELGGQAGWLLGFALVAGIAVLVRSRLRRADPRTGWLVATGGAFLTIAVAYSRAEGIFHPYYVSLLAPFVAVLVGAGVGELVKGPRVLGPAMIAAGVATELVVLHDHPDSLSWLPAVLLAGGALACVALAAGAGANVRAAVIAAAFGLLLVAPGAWAFQTLNHPTNGTFPAGGPTSAASGFGGGSGMFGGSTETTAALAYAKAHGGGTVAVSSQNGAGTQVAAGADLAAIGGFSGNESQVSAAWLADAVASGEIRWILTDSSGGFCDGRVGSRAVMAVAAEVGTEVSSVTGLYDLQGKASALRAAG